MVRNYVPFTRNTEGVLNGQNESGGLIHSTVGLVKCLVFVFLHMNERETGDVFIDHLFSAVSFLSTQAHTYSIGPNSCILTGYKSEH